MEYNRFIYQKECIEDCKTTTVPSMKYHHNSDCVVECPDDFYGHLQFGKCLSELECPDEYYADPATHKCLDKLACNTYHRFVYVSSSRKFCIDQCSDTVPLIPNKILDYNGECITECPMSYYSYEG